MSRFNQAPVLEAVLSPHQRAFSWADLTKRPLFVDQWLFGIALRTLTAKNLALILTAHERKVRTPMYFLLSLFAAIVLAIPTYGASLLVFFLVKNWFDTKAANHILNVISRSVKTEESQELYHINKAAIRKAFTMLSAKYEEETSHRLTFFSGMVKHPMHTNTISVFVVYSPRNGTKNKIEISTKVFQPLTAASLEDGSFLDTLIKPRSTF